VKMTTFEIFLGYVLSELKDSGPTFLAVIVIHQIFSLTRDWFKQVTRVRLNIPRLRLRTIEVILPYALAFLDQIHFWASPLWT